MRRKVQRATVLAAAAGAIVLAGCDLFVDPLPYDIAVERPKQNDTLIVGSPFRVQAHLGGDQAIQSAHVVIYRDLATASQDTVFIAPLSVPRGRRTLHVDTVLTVDSLQGPSGSNFDLFVSLQMKDRGGGSGPEVTILKDGDGK